MEYVKKSVRIGALISTLLLSACEPLADLLIDCIDDDGPILTPRIIPDPILNQSYTAFIQASINNEPYDDRFQYDVTVSRGLPPGLVAEVLNREVRISGAATRLGSYSVSVNVSVDDEYGNSGLSNQGTNSGLCRYNTTRNYHFTVRQGN